jgi:hypothetical protein
VKARCCPCHSAAHCRHMKRQPSLCHCCHCHGHRHCNPLPFPLPLPLMLPKPIAIPIAIGHCCRSCRCPSPPPSLSHCRQPLLLPSSSPLSIADSVTIGHHSCHLHWPSPLPFLSAIAKSCCLGTARIVFEQFKKITLTLFILFGQWAAH